MKTEELILKKLLAIERKLDNIEKIAEGNSIEEISLNKAAKLLHKSANRILEMVFKGELKAITYKANGKIRYRFRLADIKELQRNNSTNYDYVYPEFAEKIWERLKNEYGN